MLESVCLLQKGAAFRLRMGLQPQTGDLTFAGFKPGAFALYFGDAPYFHFDLEGRWQRAYVDGTHYVKSLGGTVEALRRERKPAEHTLFRSTLDFASAADLDELVRERVLALLVGLDRSELALQPPPAPAAAIERPMLIEQLQRIAAWDAAAWFRNRERYLACYGEAPFGFLPPTCSQPIVLRIEEPRATIRAPGDAVAEPALVALAAFRFHAEQVQELIGSRAAQARGIALAGGRALKCSAAELLPYLEAARGVFPLDTVGSTRPGVTERGVDEVKLDGIYAYLDDPAPPVPDRAGWARLREVGLRHVDLAVVSGCPQVRAALGRTWSDEALHGLVEDLGAANITTGLVVPVRARVVEAQREHMDGTVGLIESLPLAAGTIVYLVDDDAETSAFMGAFRTRLNPLRVGRKLKIIPYGDVS